MCVRRYRRWRHDLAAEDNAAMKHILFWVLDCIVLRHRFKLVILLGFVSLVFCINIIIKGEVTASFNIAARKAKQNRSDTPGGGGGGRLPYEMDGDARRLA